MKEITLTLVWHMSSQSKMQNSSEDARLSLLLKVHFSFNLQFVRTKQPRDADLQCCLPHPSLGECTDNTGEGDLICSKPQTGHCMVD